MGSDLCMNVGSLQLGLVLCYVPSCFLHFGMCAASSAVTRMAESSSCEAPTQRVPDADAELLAMLEEARKEVTAR